MFIGALGQQASLVLLVTLDHKEQDLQVLKVMQGILDQLVVLVTQVQQVVLQLLISL